jgi:hypothetical protein
MAKIHRMIQNVAEASTMDETMKTVLDPMSWEYLPLHVWEL